MQNIWSSWNINVYVHLILSLSILSIKSLSSVYNQYRTRSFLIVKKSSWPTESFIAIRNFFTYPSTDESVFSAKLGIMGFVTQLSRLLNPTDDDDELDDSRYLCANCDLLEDDWSSRDLACAMRYCCCCWLAFCLFDLEDAKPEFFLDADGRELQLTWWGGGDGGGLMMSLSTMAFDRGRKGALLP